MISTSSGGTKYCQCDNWSTYDHVDNWRDASTNPNVEILNSNLVLVYLVRQAGAITDP